MPREEVKVEVSQENETHITKHKASTLALEKIEGKLQYFQHIGHFSRQQWEAFLLSYMMCPCHLVVVLGTASFKVLFLFIRVYLYDACSYVWACLSVRAQHVWSALWSHKKAFHPLGAGVTGVWELTDEDVRTKSSPSPPHKESKHFLLFVGDLDRLALQVCLLICLFWDGGLTM